MLANMRTLLFAALLVAATVSVSADCGADFSCAGSK
jgi:hypothetical protein